MNENLRTNQSFFSMMHEKYGSSNQFSIHHPVPNPIFKTLFLLYDPTHLFKNIRNNWLTEKTKSLSFRDPESQKHITAKWADIVKLYKIENESGLCRTKLNYQTVYSDNFEKQKVPLVINVFNKKTDAALKMHHFDETSIFIQNVTLMWNILNVKSPFVGVRLNDPDRCTISDASDAWLLHSLKWILESYQL